MKRPELRYWDHAKGPVPEWYWEMETEAVRARSEAAGRRDRTASYLILGAAVYAVIAVTVALVINL